MLRRALAAAPLPRGTRLLVALSGGADSVALLLGLHALRRESGIEIHAAHLHHGLRGREADADLDFVLALCHGLGVPLFAARWDTRRRMRRRGLSGHAGLRVLRREFLLAAARRSGALHIATAHTADDQLETLLMRLLRGSGLPGLSGMRPRRGPWLKPLLEATRHDIERDLRESRQPWREDASNDDPRYFRSRIRQTAIPALIEAHSPGGANQRGERATRARDALARRVAGALRELREADSVLRSGARRLVERGSAATGPAAGVALAPLREVAPAWRRAALRRLWRRAAPGRPGLTLRHLEALLVLVSSGCPRSRVGLPAGCVARASGGELRIERAATFAGAREGGRGGTLASPPLAARQGGRQENLRAGSRRTHD